MLQPGVSDFFVQWAKMAPGIISYAKQKTVNANVLSLLTELDSGGQGESVGDGYTPPQCMFICTYTY